MHSRLTSRRRQDRKSIRGLGEKSRYRGQKPTTPPEPEAHGRLLSVEVRGRALPPEKVRGVDRGWCYSGAREGDSRPDPGAASIRASPENAGIDERCRSLRVPNLALLPCYPSLPRWRHVMVQTPLQLLAQRERAHICRGGRCFYLPRVRAKKKYTHGRIRAHTASESRPRR